MPEQNFQNTSAFNPASFSVSAQPSLTFSVIANASQPELSSYVQTVFHGSMGTKSPGARLSDQAPPSIRNSQDMRSVRQDEQTYYGAETYNGAQTYNRSQTYNGAQTYRSQIYNGSQINEAAQQYRVPPIVNGASKYQRPPVQFNLSHQATESADAHYYRSNQNQSFAPPADRSNLPYTPRTSVGPRRESLDSTPVLNVSHRKGQEEDNQRAAAKEPPVSISKTKLIDLRQDSVQTETPQRDQNTITQKPEFLKREAFSNKFLVTPTDKRELRTETSGKVIYLRSTPAVGHTAKLEVPKFVQEVVRVKAPEPVAETAVTLPPQPQIIRWPIVEFAHQQILFPAPVVTISQTPMEIDFVSTSQTIEAETTRIDFTEVNAEVAVEQATGQSTLAASDPFNETEAPESPFEESSLESFSVQQAPLESSPFKETEAPESPFESSPVKSSPFESTPAPESPFEAAPAQSSPFESAPAPASPFESAPAQSSPFESAPSQSSPFESAPSQPSPPSTSPFKSGNAVEPSDCKIDVVQSQPKSFVAPVKDFTESSLPAGAVYLAQNTQVGGSDLDSSQIKKNTTLESPAQGADWGAPVSDQSSNPHGGPFRVTGHRPAKLSTESTFNSSKFETSDSRAEQTPSSKIILPAFKPSATDQNANQHLSASTLQSGHRSNAKSDHQFEVPWLSPWWMLIGLIPIAIYFGTMKLFRDEDEYHSHKNELFGSRLDFGGDFGEMMGKSKSDAVYGRQDAVPTVTGPTGEAVRLDAGTSQSSIEFAESLQFELPSSTEVAQPSFEQELRIDQSPNFSESDQPTTSSKKRKRRNAGKKRSKR